jgi:Uncharacterised nucleotidyltransferase
MGASPGGARVVQLRPRATAPALELDQALWAGVDRLIGRAPELADLQSHRVEPLAARRLRAQGRPVPPELIAEERAAAVSLLVAPLLLERVRAAYGGPMLLVKGPEAAARYPDPSLRAFKDLDLLVPDADAAQAALLASGFEPIGDPALYVGIHHLRPLAAPGFPLSVEIHSRPKWPAQRTPTTTEELLAAAVPSSVGVDGVLAPSPQHHALLLAAHSWAHEPLRRLRDLVDVAAALQGLDRDEVRRLAGAWGIARLWKTTEASIDAIFLGRPKPWALRLWAQNLPRVRERTVLENHAERLLSNFWALSTPEAARALDAILLGEVQPKPGETWGTKLARSRRALRNARRRRSEHHAVLERRATPGRRTARAARAADRRPRS